MNGFYRNNNNKGVNEQDIDKISYNSYVSIDNTNEKNKKEKLTRDTIIVFFTIILGQILSMLSVSSHHLCFNLLIQKINVPCLFYAIFYLLFGLIWICVNKCSYSKPKNYYFLLLIVESQGLYTKILSVSYFAFDYIFLFYFLSSVWTFILKFILIKKYKYNLNHYVAIAVSFLGGIITIIGIFNETNKQMFYNFVAKNVYGLIFIILSSIISAISYVLQENLFQSVQEIYDYFAFSGPIIGLILFIESFITSEIHNFSFNYFTLGYIFYLLGFLVINMIFHSVIPFFIKHNTAVMYSFTLLCNVFYLYCIQLLFFEHEENEMWYYIGGVLLNLFGIIFYGKYKSVKVSKDELNIEQQFDKKEGLIPLESPINN